MHVAVQYYITRRAYHNLLDTKNFYCISHRGTFIESKSQKIGPGLCILFTIESIQNALYGYASMELYESIFVFIYQKMQKMQN